jgi:hypothetical protein
MGDRVIAAKPRLGADGNAGDITAAVCPGTAFAQLGIVRFQVNRDRTLAGQRWKLFLAHQ